MVSSHEGGEHKEPHGVQDKALPELVSPTLSCTSNTHVPVTSCTPILAPHNNNKVKTTRRKIGIEELDSLIDLSLHPRS